MVAVVAVAIGIAFASGSTPTPEPSLPSLPEPLRSHFDELWRTL
jgi:hypothetical protein